MSSYTLLDGEFLPGLFKPKLLKKNIAKIDPTSRSMGGKITRSVLGGLAAAGGTLLGLPPMITYAGVTGGLGLVGGKVGNLKSVKAAQKAEAANAEQQVILEASDASFKERVFSTLESNPLPLIIVSGVGILMLSTMFLMKK